MKKEEFPTFLNEQPTVVFGRTTRELMIIIIGCALAFQAFTNLDHAPILQGLTGVVVKFLVAGLIVLASLVVALFSVAGHPLEEWGFVLLFYLLLPKVHIYMPMEETQQVSSTQNDHILQYLRKHQSNEDDEDL